MPNSVSLEDGRLIIDTYYGDQASDSVLATSNENKKLIEKLRSEKKPVLILVDLTRLGKTHSSARKVGVDVVRDLDYDKVAIFGGSVFNKYLVNFVVTAAGRANKVKYFSLEKEARDWLDE